MNAATPHLFGRAVRLARQRKGWTQADLAEAMGVSRQWVVGLEAGRANVRLGMALAALSHLEQGVNIYDSPLTPLLRAALGDHLPTLPQ